MDLDVDHYTTEDLTQLLDIRDLTHEAVIQATDTVFNVLKKTRTLYSFLLE